MNCDYVFEILTRGPFPTGEPHDQAVEQHLAVCHECRQLAAALEPAVDMIHESLSSEAELPQYTGTATAADVAVMQRIQQAAPQSTMAHKAAAPTHREVFLWALAVSVLFLIWVVGRSSNPTQDTARTRSLAARVVTVEQRERIDALGLSTDCRPLSTQSLVRYCCVDCHEIKPTADAQRRSARVQVLTACEMCHALRETPTVLFRPFDLSQPAALRSVVALLTESQSDQPELQVCAVGQAI